ncbi:MAG: cellobiose phosphorylase [Fusobacteriota bacterium]
MEKYKVDKKKGFIIKDYNNTKPFSSFLPGIAGEKGVPLWLFYVNRGQCVASFGIENKNGSMMEFYPANKAYQFTSNYGFRTFIKLEDGSILEPFNESYKDENRLETLKIRPDEFEIEHINEEEKLKINIIYHTLPYENFAGLVRRVKIENLSDKPREIEVLDGMAAILPYGVQNDANKELGNTLRAWMNVTNMEKNIPFYKLRGGTGDSAEVEMIERGHFYLSYSKKGEGENELLKPIVDPKVIFGNNKSLSYPEVFADEGLDGILEKEQIKVNKVPAGFFGKKKKLGGNESFEMVSLIGNVSKIEEINEKVDTFLDPEYLKNKRKESNKLIKDITKNIEISTSDDMFDEYMKQNYMDNLLRGGYPVLLDGGDKSHVYHIYSRKHGDLERDYNFFSLEAGYYSQGNGNFRDVNQNRRSDILFNPEIGDFNVKMFMNLIQADGYNPLVVKGCKFILEDSKKDEVLEYVEDKELFKKLIDKPYTPGSFYGFVHDAGVKLKISEDELLQKMLKYSEQNFEAEHGEGFWIDHWTYNMDLVDTYLSVFPDKKDEFLYENKEYKYYDSPVRVNKREKKYVLANGKVRQFEAIDEENIQKRELINSRKNKENWVRTDNGKDEIYKTNLYEKLLSLSANKFATLDPIGAGVEMEAGKPGWNDSLNGLPGMFGSGVSEAFELRRILNFLIKEKADKNIKIPVELNKLLQRIEDQLDIYFNSEDENKNFIYWDKVSQIREDYRDEILYGFSGELKNIKIKDINKKLEKFIKKLEIGSKLALDYGEGVYPTYMYFEATKHEFIKTKDGKKKLNKKGYPLVKVKEFEPKRLSYFLEGPARAMKVLKDKDESQKLYKKLKASDVYDKKLKMYKTSESILDESYDIGRARAFTPGWLENESIFMHMEYKYMVSLLKAGLYNEFYEDIKTVLVPFMDPEVYGRSTLENSSFIASSANPDKSVHGQGFVARLSGSTAESLEIRNIIMAGEKPFRKEGEEVILDFSPKLPEWLFDSNNEVSFRFLGNTNVTYHNPNRKNTFGKDKAKISKIIIDGRRLKGTVIKGEDAKKVREGEIDIINIELK